MPKLRNLAKVDADYPNTGPVQGVLRQTLACDAATAFRCLEDGAAWKKWLGVDVTWTSPKPFGVGTTRTVTTRGQKIEEFFTRWEDGRRMGFRFDRTTLPMAAFAEDYLLEPRSDDECELIWSYAYEWGGPLTPVLSPVFAKAFGWNANRALGKLEALIEAEGHTWA